jgi:hypothetical protein
MVVRLYQKPPKIPGLKILNYMTAVYGIKLPVYAHIGGVHDDGIQPFCLAGLHSLRVNVDAHNLSRWEQLHERAITATNIKYPLFISQIMENNFIFSCPPVELSEPSVNFFFVEEY